MPQGVQELPDKIRTGVGICMPISGRAVPVAQVFAFKSLDAPINYNMLFHIVEGKPVDEARNICADWAVEKKVKYLFFLDEDTIVPPNTLRQFIFLLENNPSIDVIGGVYFAKCDPPFPLIFKNKNGDGAYWDWKVGELFQVNDKGYGGLGMGCTMIRTSVFDKIKKPYFQTMRADAHIDGVSRSEAWTEDLYFCRKVTDAKLKIFCDASIQCDHHDVNSGKIYKLPWNSKPAIRRYAVGDQKWLDLGCGEVGTILKEGTPIRVDMREEVNPDYRCDVRVLPFKNESMDGVFASHLLEHFRRDQIPQVIDEWLRVIRPGGELRLIVPDLTVAAKQILNGGLTKDGWNILYGAQHDQFDFHRTGFTPASMKELLASKGLKIKKLWTEKPFNLFVEAVKVKANEMIGEGQGRTIYKSDVKGSLPKSEVKASRRKGKAN